MQKKPGLSINAFIRVFRVRHDSGVRIPLGRSLLLDSGFLPLDSFGHYPLMGAATLRPYKIKSIRA